jgi:hypothetical protein
MAKTKTKPNSNNSVLSFFKRNIWACLFGGYLLYVVFVGLSGNILNAQLFRKGMKAKAVVLSKEYRGNMKKGSSGYYYSFEVNQREFTGHTTTKDGFHIGDTIVVYYLKDDPSKNKDFTHVE